MNQLLTVLRFYATGCSQLTVGDHSDSKGRRFNNSYRRVMFENGYYGDAVLLVDSDYAATAYMMPPLENPQTPEEQFYNESQIWFRNPVERLFGVWKKRFPAPAIAFTMKLEKTFAIIVATAILHNMLRQRREDLPPDNPKMDLPAPWV
ncbi:hypothetical protein ANN_14865 [Periplaneta americana]|uniref:DDE Tnp4 domain-containing protein n=1 Tax=Periplaneta americana TaxID=6978 RepID=A0ABQ8SXJ9_PERAM|nr:hypothetical protein ANN_14865 [Periplaneta americana]